MAADTSAIDSKIVELTAQLATAQQALDSDSFTVMLNQHQALAASLSSIQANINDLNLRKTNILNTDTKISELTVTLSGMLSDALTQTTIKLENAETLKP